MSEMTPDRAREIALQWHSGGGSPLYRFGSNGRIDDEAHRAALLAEIGSCLARLRAMERPNDPERDIPDLIAIGNYAAAAPIRTEPGDER